MGNPKNNDAASTALQLFVNRNKSSALSKMECTQAADGSHFVFLHGQKAASVDQLMSLLEGKLPSADLVNTALVDGVPIVIGRTKANPFDLAKEWETHSGEALAKRNQAEKKEGIDLIKVRGWVGNIGQVFLLLSGFLDSSKDIKKINSDAKQAYKDIRVFNADNPPVIENYPDAEKFSEAKRQYKQAEKDKDAKGFYSTANGEAKIRSASLSFLGNGMNSYYGVQRKSDNTRLDFAKRTVNKALNFSKDTLPMPGERITEEKEKYSFMKRNSLVISNGVKLVGKWALMQAGNKQLYAAGALSLASKVVTLVGKDEDKFQLEKDQNFLTKIRRSSNAIAGTMEWIANITLWTGAIWQDRKDSKPKNVNPFKNEKLAGAFSYFKDLIKPLFDLDNSGQRKKIQWFQLLGATAIFGSLTAKSFAPFAVKDIDTDELTAHSTLALASTVQEGKHSDELTRLSAQLVQTWEIPELEGKFATVFTDIANRLEQHHGIAISEPAHECSANCTQCAHPKTEQIAATEAVQDTRVEKDIPQSSRTAIEPKNTVSEITQREQQASLAAREVTKQQTQPEQTRLAGTL